MAEDFSGLQAIVTALVSEIATVVDILQNPAVDNNNQATIDDITNRLSAGLAALQGAVPAPAPTPAPVAAPTDTTAAPTDTTATDGTATDGTVA